MKEIILFTSQNIALIILTLFLVVLFLICVKMITKPIFLEVNLLNKILFMLSFLGLVFQMILLKTEYVQYGISLTAFISIILALLFINRCKIDNREFNDLVIALFVGQSAFCMIMANQTELDIVDNIIYAGIYIGIPMFIAYQFSSNKQNIENNKDILNKLKEIEDKLNQIDKSINISDKSN